MEEEDLDLDIFKDDIIENFYEISLTKGEKLLIVFNEENDFNDYVCTIIDFISYNDIPYVSLKTEYDTIYDLELNDNFYILKEQKIHKIIDIEKIIEFDLDEIDDVINIQLTKDIYPDIILDIEEREKKDYVFTEIEKKEDFISELINSMNIYDNELLLKQLLSMTDDIIEMINTKYDKIQLINFDKLPNWFIPISNNIKRLYITEKDKDDKPISELNEEEIIETNYDNLFIKKNNTLEFNEQFKHLDTNSEIEYTYNQIINNIYNNNYNPIQEYNYINGFLMENFNGEYYLDCLDDNCMNIDGIIYNVDNRRTRNELYYNTIIKNNIEKVILYQKENINLNKFIILPNNYNYFNTNIYYNNSFTLGEKLLLNTITYSVHTNKEILNKIIKETNLSKYDVSNDNKINHKDINLFNIKDIITEEQLDDILDKYLPKEFDIFNNIDNYIKNYIFNFTDLIKLYYKYNINITIIDNNFKNKISKIITKNINRYKDLFSKFKIDKDLLKTERKLTISEKIFFIKNFIDKQKVVLVKNTYIKKLIDKFLREPKKLEDPNFLYTVNDNTKLLCKHYVFTANMNEDKTNYDSFINNYGTKSIDGCIYCKYCNDFLDFEKKSIYQGFDEDNKPVNSYASMENEDEEDILKDLSSKDKNTKFLIEIISNKVNVKLNDYDIKELIDLYNIINNESLAIDRYENSNIMKEHYIVKDDSNIKNMKELKFHMLNSNKLLFLFVTIIIYIQTSIPQYNYKSNVNLNLIDISTDKYKTINKSSDIISIQVIDYLINRIKLLTNKYRKNDYWKTITKFIDEQNIASIPSLREQFINTITHVISSKYNKILEKIKDYKNFKDISSIVVIKNYWSTYKPLPTNKNIIEINNFINTNLNTKQNKKIQIKKFDRSLHLENISLVRKLNKKNYTDIYQLLNINISIIQNNYPFIYLHNLINTLYGIQPSNKYFNNLVNRFLDSVQNNDILRLFEKYGWNKKTNQFTRNIEFSKLKYLIDEIISYYENKSNEKASITIYKHNIINNFNLILLNGKSKRTYKYTSPQLFINKPYDNIENKQLIDRIFDKYCYDQFDRVIIDYKKEFYPNFSMFLSNNTKIDKCFKKLQPSNKNLKKILNDIYNKNKLKLYSFNLETDYKKNVYKSFIFYIENNRNILNNQNINELYNVIISHLETDKNIISDIKNIFSKLYKDNKSISDKISNYFKTTSNISEERKRNINSKSGYNIKINLINKLLNNICENASIITLKKYIKNVNLIISKINFYKNLDTITKLTQNVFHSITPKNWNLTETNKEKLELFLSNNDFLLHNKIYIEKDTKKLDNGFYNYYQSIEDMDIFYNFSKMYTNFIDIINYNNKTYLKENYIRVFLSNILLGLFNNIVDFCDNSDRAEEMISSILLDIIINMIQDYNDIRWINSIDFDILETNLSKQKEREKQNVINTLDIMTEETRAIKTQLQSAKIESYYRDSIKDNEKYINSETYTDNLDFEREEHINKLYNEFDSSDIFSETDNTTINPTDLTLDDERIVGYGTDKIEDSDAIDSVEY